MRVRPTRGASRILVTTTVWRCSDSALGQAVADCRVNCAQLRDAPAASAARPGWTAVLTCKFIVCDLSFTPQKRGYLICFKRIICFSSWFSFQVVKKGISSCILILCFANIQPYKCKVIDRSAIRLFYSLHKTYRSIFRWRNDIMNCSSIT